MRMWHGLDFRSKIRGGIFVLLQHQWDLSQKLHWEMNDVNAGMLLWNPETELCLVEISIAISPSQPFHFGEELAPSRPRDQSCWEMERPVMLGNGEQCSLSSAIFRCALHRCLVEEWDYPEFASLTAFLHSVLSFAVTSGISCARVWQDKYQHSSVLAVRLASNWTWTLGSQTIRCSWAGTGTAVDKLFCPSLERLQCCLNSACAHVYWCSGGDFLRRVTKYQLLQSCWYFFWILASLAPLVLFQESMSKKIKISEVQFSPRQPRYRGEKMFMQIAWYCNRIGIDMWDRGEGHEYTVTWKSGGRAYVLIDTKDLQELYRRESLKMQKK